MSYTSNVSTAFLSVMYISHQLATCLEICVICGVKNPAKHAHLSLVLHINCIMVI